MGTCCGKACQRNAIIPCQVNTSLSRRFINTNVNPASSMSRKLSLNYSAIPNKNHKPSTVIMSEDVSGLVGLTNLRNTCFMNSALQCLFNIPPLVDYFLNDLHVEEINPSNPLGSKGAVTFAFAHLLKQYWESGAFEEMNPIELLGAISNFAPRFCQGTQEDSHEFLVFLLDMLHEDLNRVKEKPLVEDMDYTGDLYQEYAKESWKNYLHRNKSVIVDLFQGQSKSTLKCLKCGYKSHKFEPFMYLSLPIQGRKKKISLLDCLKEYSQEEKLENRERWACPNCKKLVEVSKKLDVWNLPNILIIHLKRFSYNKKSKGSKVRKFVNFPVTDLDLSSITQGIQRDKPIYDLIAVSNHKGNLGSGHYYTYAKNRSNNNWYEYNDSKVFGLETQNVVTDSGYLLFFCKTSNESFRRQTLSRPEAWPYVMRKSFIEANAGEDQDLQEPSRENYREQESAKSSNRSGRRWKYFGQQQLIAKNKRVIDDNIDPIVEDQFFDSKVPDKMDWNNRRKGSLVTDLKLFKEQNLNILRSSTASCLKSDSKKKSLLESSSANPSSKYRRQKRYSAILD